MKKALLTKIRVQKAKRMGKRARRGAGRMRDPQDLRGAKGALLKNAIAAVVEEESSTSESAEPRHPPVRVRSDW